MGRRYGGGDETYMVRKVFNLERTGTWQVPVERVGADLGERGQRTEANLRPPTTHIPDLAGAPGFQPC